MGKTFPLEVNAGWEGGCYPPPEEKKWQDVLSTPVSPPPLCNCTGCLSPLEAGIGKKGNSKAGVLLVSN